ncbi:helix-turn-helix domain-containing protein [Brachybacterium tyrofermentans]|uniref:helix-turn-helix domain-containing protein n=2 Tax=Brachybacterium tyrofermentans TaxID=47848 RepID=UPI003FD46DA6
MSKDSPSWPALGAEPRSWTPTAGFGIRADRNPGSQTYRAAIVPAIAKLTPQVSSETMSAAEDAALSLSRLDAELGVKQPNVYPQLRALEEAGILTSKNEHQLGPFWRSDEILSAIDRFAERAGRRSLD